MARVEVEEKTRLDPAGVNPPRAMTWFAALLAAPFTGGASLLGGLIFEGLAAAGRREAARKMDRKSPSAPSRALGLIEEDIKRNNPPFSSVSYKVNLGEDGLGTCLREYTYKVRR